MKNIIKLRALVLLAVFVSFTACDTVDFGDTNVSPNAPTKGSSKLLLTNIERSVSGYTTSVITSLYSQYISEGQYPEASQYEDIHFSFDGAYGVLTEIQRYIKLNTDDETKVNAAANGSNNNQIAAGTILRVYYLKIMAERWGMIPYTESLQGLDNPYPKFDDQLFVYQELMKELDGALALIGGGTIEGDFIFKGNMSTWAKFGNTLKMVMALNLSEADPTLGKAKFNEALGKTIASNGDNLFYPYLTDDVNDNPWQDRFQTRIDYLMSDTFVDALVGTGTSTVPEDPRLPKMAAPAKNSGEYVGAPYGKQNTALSDYSFITGDIIYNGAAPGYIFTYSEILFARAEAAQLGWTGETAATLYADAVKASMEQWGVAAADITTYQTANPFVDMKSIAYEKWVAQFLQGYNSWTDYRRFKASGMEKPLSIPAIVLTATNSVPNRHGYATRAKDLNEDNYNAAVASQGTDDLNTLLTLFK